MYRIDFHKPLTALEIRDPAVAVCSEVAEKFGLYVTFHQPQQRAFTGSSFDRKTDRIRIGNGKHKNWRVDVQEDEPYISKPRVLGRIVLKAPYDPENMQFGGFEYGLYDEDHPRYQFITIHTPTEFGLFRPIDPSPDLLEMTLDGLVDQFESGYPRLFDVASYSSLDEFPPNAHAQ